VFAIELHETPKTHPHAEATYRVIPFGDGSFGIEITAKGLQSEIFVELGPPPEGLQAEQNLVVPMTLVRGTRGYIERIANQVNGAYENGWYDACAVMIRRLLETLIIEAFEKHNIA